MEKQHAPYLRLDHAVIEIVKRHRVPRIFARADAPRRRHLVQEAAVLCRLCARAVAVMVDRAVRRASALYYSPGGSARVLCISLTS